MSGTAESDPPGAATASGLNLDDTIDSAPDPFTTARARTMFFAYFCGSVLVVLAARRTLGPQTRNPWVWLALYVVLTAILLVYFRRHRIDLKRLMGPLDLGGYGTIILLAPLALLPFELGTLWLQNLVIPARAVPKTPFDLSGPLSIQRIVLMTVLTIGAPILEELTFRGFLLHRWARKWGIRAGIILSSLAFGILHPVIIGSVVTGAVLALVYLRTRRLLAGMVLHSWYNGIIVILSALTPSHTPNPAKLNVENTAGITALLFGSILLVPIIRTLLVGLDPTLPYDDAAQFDVFSP